MEVLLIAGGVLALILLSLMGTKAVLLIPILAIIAAVALPGLVSTQHRARVAQCRADLRNLEQALQVSQIDLGKYPSSGNANMVRALSAPPGAIPYLVFPPEALDSDGRLLDPWKKPFVYLNNADGSAPPTWAPRNRSFFDLYSYGPDGVDNRGEGDDVTNWR